MDDGLRGRLVCGVRKGTRFGVSPQFLQIPFQQAAGIPLIYLIEILLEIQSQFVVLSPRRRHMVREWRYSPRGNVFIEGVLCLGAESSFDKKGRRGAGRRLGVEDRIRGVVRC